MLVSALLSSTAAPRAHAQNDAPIFTWPGKVKVSTSTLEIREGESATYNLWLTRQPSADGWWVRVHVDGVVRYDGGFDQDEGYKGIRWTPSVGWEFNKNNSNPAVATPPRGFTIRAVQDADDEDELVEFTHEVWDENTNCPPSLHGIAKVTVRIIDDDRDSGGTLPKLSIQDTPVVEGNTAEFRVRLTPSSEQTVTVDFATADVTAEAGTDYTAQSDTLTFRAGQTIKRIFVPTTDDRFHEPEEHFRVTLSNPSGATLANATGEGRISDNDRPELSIGSASVEEGNTARFEVRLAPPSEQTVTVAYATMNVTAEAGTDYTARSGTLTFSARQTMMTISVPTTDDTERESDEHFRVTLSNPSGATLNDATGEGTIFDNDGGPTMPELSIGDASVEEGGMARFEVRLAPSNDQTVTVAYSTTDGTAAAGTDYTAQSDTLTFPASQTAVTMTISVQTTDDDEQESDERFMVILSSPSGATLNDDTGEGTIIDNDGDGGNGGGNGGGGGDGGGGNGGGNGGGGGGGGDGSRDVGELPTLSIDDATVVEGDLAKFEVTLSEAATAVVMVDYSTVDGTAVARSDYTTTSGTLSFEQGEERKTILVPTVQDATAEETEVFTMQLSSQSGATVANGTGTGTITDDDEPPMLTIDDAPPVDEGDAAAFVVRLSAASGLAVTVSYRTVDGTAVAGSDYKSASGELRFEPGETTQTVSVETLADELAEDTEQFTVELSAPLGATVADGIGEGTISDDDDAPELSIDDVPAVSEGETAEFTVRLSATSGRTVSVSYRTVDGTAVAGSDYKSASGGLRFEPGETTQTVSVETLEDELSEDAEQFTVELSAASGATVSDGIGEGTISDDDDAPELSIDDAPAVSEGETAEFTVRLSAASGRAVSVSYRTVDGTAVAGSDYKSASGELRFEPGETTQTVSVETLADELAEDTEQFTVELSAPLGATVADGVGEGTISDDDDAPELSIDDVPAVSEGETAEFTVRLSATSGRTVSVSYRTVDGTAVAGSDYKSASGELRFEPGETTQTVSVETLEDELSEDAERFTVELSAASGATVSDGIGEGTISDDDDAPELSIDDAPAVSEGETAEFTVRLSAASGRAVSVSYRTVDGTAVAGSDYKSASGELRFEPGETTQAISVETLADGLAEDVERFTVELSAPSGATVSDGIGEGTISDDVKERIGKINRVILPEVGRALAFSAVTCRIDQVLAGGTTRGRAALPPARPSLSPALASDRWASQPSLSGRPSLSPALTSGRWASQPSLSGRPSLSPALTSGRWAAAGTQPLPLERTLDDLSFPARSQEEEGGDGRFAAWGCADHRNLSGDPYGPIAWSGGVSSVHMGADTRLGPGLLAGLSLSRSWGSFDYQVGGRNSAASGGEYQLGMAGVHPYLAWSVSPDLDVWGTVSHYWGDIRIVDDLVGRVQTSPATLNSGMMGVSGRLMTRGATTVKLKGDWGLARINAAGGGKVFEEATANIRRLRLRTEVSHARKLSAGKSLTPWGELGVRHDGGDGQHGAGLEVGGGLRFQDLGGGLTAESYGRWLALHHGTLQEWGFGALLRYAPGRSGRGPSVSLGPSWGDTASGVQRLWERGVTDPTLYEVPGSRLDAQFGYGFTAFRGRGLLTPYARLSLAHDAARGYRLGSRLALGPSASVSIEAQRREYPAAPINHALLVLVTLPF